VLQPEAREYYDLDGLYAQCPKVDLSSVTLPRELTESELKLAE
jgi:hypothetical protein